MAGLLAVCLSCPAAWGEDPGHDEVALKNGGSIRGTVLVLEPGKSVEIAVTGEPQPRVVPWSEVETVQKGKYAPPAPPVAPLVAPAANLPPPPSSPPPPPSPPSPKLGEPGVVRVHIDSPLPATLVHEYLVTYPVVESWEDRFGNTASRGAMATGTVQAPLCSSPCDHIVDDSTLRILGNANGNEFPSSPLFDFGGMTGDVTLHVRPGHYWALTSGVAALVVGSLAAVAGAILLPLNQSDSTTTDANTGAKVHVPDPALRTAGIGLVAGGVVAVGGGIALLFVGWTRVTVDAQPGTTHALVKPRYWMGEF